MECRQPNGIKPKMRGCKLSSVVYEINILDRLMYLLTAVGLTPGGSSTVHIYTQTIHRTKQLIWEQCGPCPVFASYTLAFALRLRKKHGKPQSG